MKIAQVAIPSPLNRLFDYYWPYQSVIQAGQRVTVPFGKRKLVGVVFGESESPAVAVERMREVEIVHDQSPVLPVDMLQLLHWASRYYHHPIGEVLATAMPTALRKGAAQTLPTIKHVRIKTDATLALTELARAPLQRKLLHQIAVAGDSGCTLEQLQGLSKGWRPALQQLLNKGFVEQFTVEPLVPTSALDPEPTLSDEQADAVERVRAAYGCFQGFLLNGITGSGKTEVYLRLIREQVEAHRQVLVLVPEISLTPQLMSRFQRRIPGTIVGLHSSLNETERLHHWLLAAQGRADVVIGTRSAIFTPLPRLGLIVIDEEHDASLKQQDGFRYHARDLALKRAQGAKCPVVLGTATPALETLQNARSDRFVELKLTRRAGNAKAPGITLLDIRRRPLQEGMSDRLLQLIDDNLGKGEQSLVFINRRGFAPTLLCNDCGTVADCRRCDAHMTVHAKLNCLRCHHCGSQRAIPTQCEACASPRLDKVGYGTERIAGVLQESFPEAVIARVDRDTTRRKGALQQHLADATSGKAQILVGTQMLAKGHHFPGVTLVGILDCDRGLYGTDYRALEQMGQLIVQVAGRAGRAQQRGQVVVQTRNPDNVLLHLLVQHGYDAFASHALEERKLASLPPFAYVALVRAEATDRAAPAHFLNEIRLNIEALANNAVQLFGPVPAPMERVGGRFRAQLMLQANKRSAINQALARITTEFEASPSARKIRWSIDVDPVDFL